MSIHQKDVFPFLQDCWKYLVTEDKWALFTTSLFYHDRKPGAVYNNSIYIVDSINAEVYNPSTKVWSKWPAMSAGPIMACTVIWRDTLNLFGGYPNINEGAKLKTINFETAKSYLSLAFMTTNSSLL